MTKSNPDSQQESDAETLEKLQSLKDFAAQFLDEDFVSLNAQISLQAALAMNKLPIKLREYLKEIDEMETQVSAEQGETEQDETDPVKKEEARKKKEESRKKREQKIEKLSHEIFIISCASSKAVDGQKTDEFLRKFNLAKKINEVGENGLSPVSAMMVSGKNLEEKKKGLEMLVQAGARISAQDLAVAGVKKVEVEQENLRQREREKEGPARKKLSFKTAQEDAEKSQIEAQARVQQQIIEAGIALEFHQMGMLALRDQLRAEAAKLNKEQEAKKLAEKTSQDVVVQEVEKSKAQTTEGQKEQKISQEKISELEKILGIPLDEKSINSMLFFAVQNGQSTMAMLLVSYGADVNHVENGKTVLDAAIKGGNNSLISVFFDRANPEAKKQALAANPNNEGLARMVEKSEGVLISESVKLPSETRGTSKLDDLIRNLPLPAPPTSLSQVSIAKVENLQRAAGADALLKS
ncbi:MAG: ankyrin repeat domain-containing protein [Rickettsiales bacterium]|nr:ankyrin repeat domain-containing protein [Rickettsiales bacterium]